MTTTTPMSTRLAWQPQERTFTVERILAARGQGRKRRYLVKWEGYEAEAENRAGRALARLERGRFSCAIVDVMLGTESGLALVRAARERGLSVVWTPDIDGIHEESASRGRAAISQRHRQDWARVVERFADLAGEDPFVPPRIDRRRAEWAEDWRLAAGAATRSSAEAIDPAA